MKLYDYQLRQLYDEDFFKKHSFCNTSLYRRTRSRKTCVWKDGTFDEYMNEEGLFSLTTKSATCQGFERCLWIQSIALSIQSAGRLWPPG